MRRTMAMAMAALMMSFALWQAGRAEASPGFPGAEGFGASATGGRGGRIIKVTTLSPTGPGSLQEALSTPGPRIIVFEVSGVIEGDVVIEHGDVTIAGQSAPGAGITIHGRLFGEYNPGVTNIIIRHIRVRAPRPPSPQDGDQYDAVQISRNRNFILDHVSAAWGSDETVDIYEAHDASVQWSIIGMSRPYDHPKWVEYGREHNYGLINGPDGKQVSVHHNLFAHNANRNPAIANGPADVINNVAYNHGRGFHHHNPASGEFNVTGNYYKRGAHQDHFAPFMFDAENAPSPTSLRYYVRNNYVDDKGTLVGLVDDPWQEPLMHPSFEHLLLGREFGADATYDFGADFANYIPVTLTSPEEAWEQVLSCAGAFPRDIVDSRAVREVKNGTGDWGALDDVDLMKGLTPTPPLADTDDDGIPNTWEIAHNLNPNDASDQRAEMPSGETAIEAYLNERAAAVLPDGCSESTGGSGDSGDSEPEPGDGGEMPDGNNGGSGGDPSDQPTGSNGGNDGVYGSAGCQAEGVACPSWAILIAVVLLGWLRRRREDSAFAARDDLQPRR